MELLNGKAKELFLEYYWQTKIKPLPMTICKREDIGGFFETLVDIFQHAIIIEWLDSVDIHIEVGGADFGGVEYWYNIQRKNTINGHKGRYFYTRQEATTEAIKKAVELINKDYEQSR